MLRRSKKLRVHILQSNIPWCVAVGCSKTHVLKTVKIESVFIVFPKTRI